MRIRARHYATGELVDVACTNGLISAVEAPSIVPPDLTAGWVAPALFDLQINGCEGIGFHSDSLTKAKVRRVVRICRRHGVGAFCATVVTSAHDVLVRGLRILHEACESNLEVAAAIPAIHLEGPYISPEDGPRGAHPRQHVRNPDWDEFCRLQEAAGGRIRLTTLAPERDGALPFIERLVHADVVVAIGHTAANPQCIRDAISAGARLSTHLGNGAHAMLPRHPNYIWEQLAADELWASLICDGEHLPAAVVRCMVRVKSPARIILTCDAGTLAGLSPGRYRDWDQEFEVLPSGRIVVPDSDYLAGSWSFTDACIGKVIRSAGVTLQEAMDMAGARPRELLSLPPRRLQPGDGADLVLFDWERESEVRVRATIIAGQLAPAEEP